jgi:hypothetical protein
MKRIHRVIVNRIEDQQPDASYLEQEGLGFEDRLQQYRDGQFSFVGVQAEAEVLIPATEHEHSTKGHAIVQRITSGGLWGIESDSDAPYFVEIEKEQLDELAQQLYGLGFSKRAVSAAFKNVVR